MPKADVVSVCPRARDLQQLIKSKKRWKVSVSAMAYRLHKIGLLTDWRYRDFCIEITQYYGQTEPDGIAREKSTVWEKVLQSLWADGKTDAQIASDVCLPSGEVSDLLFGLLAPSDLPSPVDDLPLFLVARDQPFVGKQVENLIA